MKRMPQLPHWGSLKFYQRTRAKSTSSLLAAMYRLCQSRFPDAKTEDELYLEPGSWSLSLRFDFIIKVVFIIKNLTVCPRQAFRCRGHALLRD